MENSVYKNKMQELNIKLTEEQINTIRKQGKAFEIIVKYFPLLIKEIKNETDKK